MKYQQPLFATASTHTLVTSLETPSNVDYFQKRVFLFGMNADQGSSDAGFQGNLFKLTYSKNNTAYDYLIPDAIYSSFMPESYTWNQTVASYSYSSAEYQMSLSCESNFDFGLSFGGISMNWFEVSVATSVDYQYASDIFASYEAVLVTSRAKTKTWSASLSNYMAPDQMNLIQLDSEFEYLVSKLPIEYNFDKYLSFVEGGTHYVKKLTMGAKYSCRTFFENATLATMKSEGIDIDVTASESTWFEATSKAAHISKSTGSKFVQDMVHYHRLLILMFGMKSLKLILIPLRWNLVP